MTDLTRELERRARRGQPFCIVMARIDGFEKMRARGGAATDDTVKIAAGHVAKCIRTFDDAYRFREDSFVATLKHSDLEGGLKFVRRLQNILKEADRPLSMSYCVAEPMPGDEIAQFIKHVENDLDKIAASGFNEVGKHEDMSPLQRFVKSIKDH